jgi:hypothetical protein
MMWSSNFAEQDFDEDKMCFMGPDYRYSMEATNDAVELTASARVEFYLDRVQFAVVPRFYKRYQTNKSYEKGAKTYQMNWDLRGMGILGGHLPCEEPQLLRQPPRDRNFRCQDYLPPV